MPIADASAQELLEALDHINVLLACTTPAAIGQLATMRFRVMRALISFLAKLDERCSRLRSSASEHERALARTIEQEVFQLRSLVNAHVSRWTPNAIKADLASYKTASDQLQHAMRKVAAHPTT